MVKHNRHAVLTDLYSGYFRFRYIVFIVIRLADAVFYVDHFANYDFLIGFKAAVLKFGANDLIVHSNGSKVVTKGDIFSYHSLTYLYVLDHISILLVGLFTYK